jgi:hypothetical protein
MVLVLVLVLVLEIKLELFDSFLHYHGCFIKDATFALLTKAVNEGSIGAMKHYE